jgi:hypothetical protein
MEQVGKRPPSKTSVPPKTEESNDNESNIPPINTADEKIGVHYVDPPIPHPMTQTTISSTVSQLPRSQPQTPKFDPTIPQVSQPTPVIPPRIASPNSLEAYFLERKRRGVSGGSASPRIVTPTPGVKGKFKSTPLNASERDTADGAKNKGPNEVTRDEDGSAPAPETVSDSNKSNPL